MKTFLGICCALALVGASWLGVAGWATAHQDPRAVQGGGGLAEALPQIPELRQFSLQNLDLPNQAGPASVNVTLGTTNCVLTLTPHSMRSDDFRLLVQGADGQLRQVDAPPPSTYRGTVAGMPGSRVRATLSDGTLKAYIVLPDGNLWCVQPLSDFMPQAAGTNAHVVFNGCSDVDLPGHYRCGADDIAQPQPEGTGGGGGTAGTGYKVCDVACDSDVEFYTKNSSSVVNTMKDIETVMNNVESIYENDVDITYEVTTIVVRTAEPDPYTATAPDTLLGQFRTEWNANMRDIRRDIAHFFTGKEIDGGVIGIAYLSVICANITTGNGYGLSQSRFTTNMTSRTCLTAHEMGHNWSAQHCDAQATCYIMCSGLGGCDNNCTMFEPSGVTSITNHKNSRSCLSNLSDPIPLPFSDTFPNVVLDASKWSYANGTAITSGGFNPPSVPNELTLNAAGAGTYQDDDIRTNFILLQGATNVVASYYTQHRGVENGETLIVEYWANTLQWKTLNTVTSDGVDETTFTQWTHNITAADALHNEFRLRFRPNVNETNDNWYVDNVQVTGTPVQPFLVNVNSTPSAGVAITASPLDNNGQGNGTTNFNRTWNSGTTVTLVAPATGPGGSVFSEWKLNNVSQGPSTTLNFLVAGATTAEAVYKPIWSLTVASLPASGALIAVSPLDRFAQGNGTTPFVRSYLDATVVTLGAPPTHNSVPFSHWTINGVDQPPGQLIANVTMTANSTTIANYAAATSRTLTISSTPANGVGITVSPNDNNGQGNGTTQFARVYDDTDNVTLTAPKRPLVGALRHSFGVWSVNGVDQTAGQLALNHVVNGDAALVAEYALLGDMDGNDAVDFFDIDVFILALNDPAGYALQYPGLDRVQRGDINDDGALDFFDIDGFIACVLNAGCQ